MRRKSLAPGSEYPLPRPVSMSLALMLATVLIGVVVRFAPLGLPPFLVKYGGSTMWALMIYWMVSAMLPSWRPLLAALAAGLIATVVEFVKLFHSPALDAFRLTLPGILILGRFFSVRDVAAYWLAITAGALLDQRIRRHLRP